MANKALQQIPKNLYRGKRNKIAFVLITELQDWKSTTKCTTEEFCKLVEKIYQVACKK